MTKIGLVPQPGATPPYPEFNGFNNSFIGVHPCPYQEVFSMVSVTTSSIILNNDWLRFVGFVHYSVVFK